MTEPGWYYAQGDPPGIERYWDGTAWVPETRQGAVQNHPAPVAPSYPPAPGPAPFHQPPTAAPFPPPMMARPPVDKKGFPDVLRVGAIVLSVVKVIPWLFAVLISFLAVGLATSFDPDGWNGLFGTLFDATVVLFVLVIVAGLLLVVQFVGAIQRKTMMVFVPALIMALFDGALMVTCIIGMGRVNNDSTTEINPLGVCLTIIVVAVVQIAVAVLALRAHLYKSDSPASATALSV